MTGYTLDDAHDALAAADHLLDKVAWSRGRYPVHVLEAFVVVRQALEAIEADLPEPCERCHSDQCVRIHMRWRKDCRPMVLGGPWARPKGGAR